MPVRPQPPLVRSVVATLTRTPVVLEALTAGLPADVARGDEGPGTWGPHGIVAHLIEGERTDWIPRARLILSEGETRAFHPFEREPPARAEPLKDLVAEFTAARRANVEILLRFELVESDLARRGVHPEFGAVTLGQLLATWAAHDLSHVRQIARVLAKRFAADVGPWVAYLPVLRERGGDSGGSA